MSQGGYRHKKRFGQHFLTDQGVIDAIVQAIYPQPGQSLIEIGPGQGVLTRHLLKACGALTVVEIDRDLAGQLAGRLAMMDGDVQIINQDVLNYDFPGSQLRVVGNLPYNISTPLLFHLFACHERIADMHFMLQKEVVDRLVASPGSKAYGRLSVMAQFHATMVQLFDVPPEAFDPPPKVDSSVIRLTPRAMSVSERALEGPLEHVSRQAFSQRRKTLRNALSGVLSEAQIESVGIEASARAETVSVEGFLALAQVTVDQPARLD